MELIGNDVEAFNKLPVRERVRNVMCNYVDAIRARPKTVELLAAEMMAPSEITSVFTEALMSPGQTVAEFVKLDEADADLHDQVWNLIFTVNGLVSYLAIRERNNPTYLGMDLKEDESWQFLRDTVADITEKYLAG